jgi:transposase
MAVRKRRQYTREFKADAVRLARQPDRSLSEVARSLGIPKTMLFRWGKELDAQGTDAFRGHGQRTAEADEVWKLKQELAKVSEERDILKKALAYFAGPQR